MPLVILEYSLTPPFSTIDTPQHFTYIVIIDAHYCAQLLSFNEATSMISWLDLTQTIASDTSDTIKQFGSINNRLFTGFTSVQTELNNSLLAENTRFIQQTLEHSSFAELAQLQSQIFTAKMNVGVKAFSQFLSFSGDYRNAIHHMAENSLLSIGDRSRS